jgi:hypothetical protein
MTTREELSFDVIQGPHPRGLLAHASAPCRLRPAPAARVRARPSQARAAFMHSALLYSGRNPALISGFSQQDLIERWPEQHDNACFQIRKIRSGFHSLPSAVEAGSGATKRRSCSIPRHRRRASRAGLGSAAARRLRRSRCHRPPLPEQYGRSSLYRRRLPRRPFQYEPSQAEPSRAQRSAAQPTQKSIRIEMIQNGRKIPWTKACTLSFTVGWWKESVRVIGQRASDMPLSRE